ncbi:MAG: transcriptional regulator with XRE-family HTH domain [Phenylobacterium sp.]|jgi:transcriptional regulator with XRE-family HTH domain
MKINNPNELSIFLKGRRKQSKRSQSDVAVNTGVQQQTISAFERQSSQAKIDTLFRIVNELGLEFHLEDKGSALRNGGGDGKNNDWQEEW